MRADEIFLEIARKDLDAAKILLHNKMYPQSLFYLQQAIEKATKAFGIWSKTITENEAKEEIGHAAWKLYSKIFNKTKDKLVELEKYLKAFPKLKEVDFIKKIEASKTANGFEKLKRPDAHELYHFSFSENNLRSVVREIDEIKDAFEKEIEIKIEEKEIEGFKEELHQLLDAFSEFYPEAVEVEKAKIELDKAFEPQLVKDLSKNIMELLPKFIFCYMSLFYLSLIFSPHAIKSRYPEDNFIPLEVYDEKMPLIRMLGSFIKIAEETLEEFGYIRKI